jgi:hypothetical protein
MNSAEPTPLPDERLLEMASCVMLAETGQAPWLSC